MEFCCLNTEKEKDRKREREKILGICWDNDGVLCLYILVSVESSVKGENG